MNTDEPLDPTQDPLLQAALRDVDVPGAARESAISAALAVFDEVHATSIRPATPPALTPADSTPGIAPTVAPNVVPLRRRSWWSIGLTGAAAAAVVLFVAIGMFRPNNSEVQLSDAPPRTTPALAATQAQSMDEASPAPANAPLGGNADAATKIDSGPLPLATTMADVRAMLTESGYGPVAERTSSASSDTAVVLADDAGDVPSCAGALEVALTVDYQGTPALVVVDTDGSFSVIAMADCTMLVQAFRLES